MHPNTPVSWADMKGAGIISLANRDKWNKEDNKIKA
jgi:hypothetical protein